MALHDSHKITKSVTKFWISIKRTDRSHRFPIDTNKDCNYKRESQKHSFVTILQIASCVIHVLFMVC